MSMARAACFQVAFLYYQWMRLTIFFFIPLFPQKYTSHWWHNFYIWGARGQCVCCGMVNSWSVVICIAQLWWSIGHKPSAAIDQIQDLVVVYFPPQVFKSIMICCRYLSCVVFRRLVWIGRDWRHSIVIMLKIFAFLVMKWLQNSCVYMG